MRDLWRAIVEAQSPEVAFYPVANVLRDVPSDATYPHVRWQVNTNGLRRDEDRVYKSKFNIAMSVFLETPTDRTANRALDDHSAALDIARKILFDFDATYNNDTYQLVPGDLEAIANIEIGTDNRTGVFVTVEVADNTAHCADPTEIEIPSLGCPPIRMCEAPEDGQTIQWNAAEGKWEPVDMPTGGGGDTDLTAVLARLTALETQLAGYTLGTPDVDGQVPITRTTPTTVNLKIQTQEP
jgi:hypothetical protein